MHCGDAVQVMNDMPDESVDLIFADPPYGLSNGGFTCHAGKRAAVDKGEWDKSQGAAADFSFHTSWIAACRRTLKPNGTIWISGTYHSIYACGLALQQGGWHILNDICWFKSNAPPNLSCRMFAASHETLIWARKAKGAKHVFNYEVMRDSEWERDTLKKHGKQMRSVWQIGAPQAAEKAFGKHPTQKPVKLLRRIVLACTNPQDTVLDPFCGSATTGVAALGCDRKFIGIDSSKEYLSTMAIPRLKQAKPLKATSKSAHLFRA